MDSKIFFVALAWFAINTYAASVPVDPDNKYLERARQAVAEMAKMLRGELQTAMLHGGPGNAIKVCRDKAPKIADAIGKVYGLSIDRTSLKPRRRAPDAWEKQVLTQFERRKASGEPVSTLEYFEITKNKGQPAFRYMKAIETKPVCLACHGKQLAPEIEQNLKDIYPNDQARGFKVGDIRGAFTVAIPLQCETVSP